VSRTSQNRDIEQTDRDGCRVLAVSLSIATSPASTLTFA
jgi:hypothetical protein